ncbi:hypothetical protein [Fructobacillus tropaeoli]|uniref:hypothetical protein n=1 Tax=Fructobacillus tropaeoli TaxID=709323 RepID=UPI00194318DB|nr:hypothetical protein [Fructobacillus tropaeoli]GIC69418.1 hypothetical protein FT12353_00540 [Fructobacillus tropaeoli]
MTKELRVRYIDDQDYQALVKMGEENGYETTAAFMRDVIKNLTKEMTTPQNNIAKVLEKIEANKNEILQSNSLIESILSDQVELLNRILEDNYD